MFAKFSFVDLFFEKYKYFAHLSRSCHASMVDKVGIFIFSVEVLYINLDFNFVHLDSMQKQNININIRGNMVAS